MITKIKVRILSIMVNDDSDRCGAGEWHLHATAEFRPAGTTFPIGDPQLEYEARSGMSLPSLPEVQWSKVLDVATLGPGSSVVIRLRVKEHDVFGEEDLGEVTMTIPYPFEVINSFNMRGVDLHSNALNGDGVSYYRATILVTIEEEIATTDAGPSRVPVRRNMAGNVTLFSTIKGTPFTPRVEVCPVIPLPAPPAHMPVRPPMPPGLAAGVAPPSAQLNAAPAAPRLNAIPNPAVIPILDMSDPNLANKQARLTVTYYEPGNIDTSKFYWRVTSGPAEIIGSNRGPTINVRGTGEAADTLATFEVRWENDAGPLLTTYRAWVGKLGTLYYRVTFLDGINPDWVTSTVMTSEVANNIMQVVRAIFYQAGIMLVPDPDVTGFEGAELFPANNNNAIFRVTVSNNQHTRNVNHNIISRSTRYNFRPGVINFAIIHSSTSGTAAAVDRNGIAGTPSKTQWHDKKLWYAGGGVGSTKDLDGSPSASWIKPSGIPLDDKGIKKTLKTIIPTDRVKQAKAIDKGFVSSRNTKKLPFTAAMMGQLYACHIPVVWCLANLVAGTWTQDQYEWNCGINFAHELGHILGLAHRGSGGYNALPVPLPAALPSADGMDCADTTGYVKGHPWNENLMSYGFVMDLPLAHNIDLIQAMVIRMHPAITY